MKRSEWIRNNQAEGADRLSLLADFILGGTEWQHLRGPHRAAIAAVVLAEKHNFIQALRPAIIEMLGYIVDMGGELSVASKHPYKDFLALQLWKNSDKTYTFNVIFHPGPGSINCITTFLINAEKPKLLEVSKVKAFMQINGNKTSS